jgi:pyrimidine operon attenuation protein/uracil phosphoribosyltransferase
MHQHDRVALTLLHDETLDAGGLELPARAPVPFYRLRNCGPHNEMIARCGFAPQRGLSALLRWPRQAPLTRSGEARKEPTVSDEKVVLDHDDLRRTLVRIAHEIVEKNDESDRLALVGIHTRGAVICRRLHALVGELSGADVPLGDLDISFYRDDIERREPRDAPVVHDSHLDFDLAGRTVVLVDDVLYTGRTVRAAIDALFDYGRPARVQLAVLADRGHRELPIRPDYVGKNLPTAPGERVNVRLEETDGVDEVAITPAGATATAKEES